MISPTDVNLATLLHRVRREFGNATVDLHDASLSARRYRCMQPSTHNGLMFAILPMFAFERSTSDCLYVIVYTIDLTVIQLEYLGDCRWRALGAKSGVRPERCLSFYTSKKIESIIDRLGTCISTGDKKRLFVTVCHRLNLLPVDLVRLTLDFIGALENYVICKTD